MSSIWTVKSWCEPSLNIHILFCLAVLLLLIGSGLVRSQEIKYVAVSSNLTFHLGECSPNAVYRIYHRDVKLHAIHIFCNSPPLTTNKFEGRIEVNKSSGYATLINVTKSDAGYYKLEHTNGNGGKKILLEAEVKILDEAWINDLYRNHTDETISLTVGCAGELYAVTWTMDGGDLLDRHWLSDDHRTLIVPYNVTDRIFAVHVSNPVGADTKYIALIKDLNGKFVLSGPIMFWNISRVIWGEGGGQANDHILILPRNVANISVMSLPESGDHQFVHGWWGLLASLIVVVVVLVVLLVCKKKIINCTTSVTKKREDTVV